MDCTTKIHISHYASCRSIYTTVLFINFAEQDNLSSIKLGCFQKKKGKGGDSKIWLSKQTLLCRSPLLGYRNTKCSTEYKYAQYNTSGIER